MKIIKKEYDYWGLGIAGVGDTIIIVIGYYQYMICNNDTYELIKVLGD